MTEEHRTIASRRVENELIGQLQEANVELDRLQSHCNNLVLEKRQLHNNLSAAGDEIVRLKHKLAAFQIENKELRQGIVRTITDEFDRRGKADDEPE